MLDLGDVAVLPAEELPEGAHPRVRLRLEVALGGLDLCEKMFARVR